MSTPVPIEDQSIWRDLGDAAKHAIRQAMRLRRVVRGETLIEQGAPSTTLYIVDFGLFEVRNAETGKVIAEIGKDQLIGEMGFFSGEPRVAAVIALRDSAVLEIDRADFDRLASNVPELGGAVTRALAKRLTRLAGIVRRHAPLPDVKQARVVVFVQAGAVSLRRSFRERLRRVTHALGRARFLTSENVHSHFGCNSADRHVMANWLADIERENDLVICVADDTLTDWTRTALHSADQLLLVASGAPAAPNVVERYAFDIFPAARRRLVRLHAKRTPMARPTSPWLEGRDVFMAHHLSLEDDADFASLLRFLTGRAIGFVAGGGGAFGLAHIGVFKAFTEEGIGFDMHGGSSVGAAMTAAFARLATPEDVEAGVHEMFVRRGALKRLALPIYGLLDHTVLDEALQQLFGPTAIEDLWKPYFAVATDLSTYSTRIIRKGPVWEAIRASCAIPGVLPPFFDKDGHMLVDGGVVDNVPARIMNALKSGPNVVVDLAPRGRSLYGAVYPSIPGRWALLARLLNPLAWRRLPHCPGPASVIQQSLFANIRDAPTAIGVQDLMLHPPPLAGAGIFGWSRHREAIASAEVWTRAHLQKLRDEGDGAFASMTRLSLLAAERDGSARHGD